MGEYEKLIYTNERGDSITLSPKSVYHCNIAKDCKGISDISNKIYTTNSMGQQGDTYIGQRIEPRDITITGSIATRDKDYSLDLRRKMQKVLNPELDATLTYVYKNFKKVIDCKGEDAPKFTRKGIYQDFTVSLTCPDPFWREENEDKDDIAEWIGSLMFELEINESEGIEFGYREPSVIVDVYNDGDVATGMRIEFRAIGTLTNPQLLNMNTGEFIKIGSDDNVVTLIAGDIVVVNTEYGKKGATLTRGGVSEDYFRYIDVDSTFMQLEIGDNVFRYGADTNPDLLEVSVYHSNKYLGV
jgi:hypothetical protein